MGKGMELDNWSLSKEIILRENLFKDKYKVNVLLLRKMGQSLMDKLLMADYKELLPLNMEVLSRVILIFKLYLGQTVRKSIQMEMFMKEWLINLKQMALGNLHSTMGTYSKEISAETTLKTNQKLQYQANFKST